MGNYLRIETGSSMVTVGPGGIKNNCKLTAGSGWRKNTEDLSLQHAFSCYVRVISLRFSVNYF